MEQLLSTSGTVEENEDASTDQHGQDSPDENDCIGMT